MKLRSFIIGINFILIILSGAIVALAGNSSWQYFGQIPLQNSEVKLKRPIFIDIDWQRQRYYVVEIEGKQLVSFDKERKMLTAFNADASLKVPIAMARDSQGNVWVVERAENQLLYIDFKEKKIDKFTLTHTDGSLVFIDRLAIGPQDFLFVLDRMQGAILKLDDSLKVIKIFSSSAQDFSGFHDFKIKSDGLWALDGFARKIYHFNTHDDTIEVINFTSTDLQFPIALELDDSKQIYVLDRHAGHIGVYDQKGRFKYNFIERGKRNGRLWYASNLIFDWEGRLCVVDEGNGRIEMFTR
ncbi:MAG: hypothetical protein JW786_03310 [Desulfobacterales bacterium]|nr:hypothetical protein [Desulfobacterales bacterium]